MNEQDINMIEDIVIAILDRGELKITQVLKSFNSVEDVGGYNFIINGSIFAYLDECKILPTESQLNDSLAFQVSEPNPSNFNKFDVLICRDIIKSADISGLDAIGDIKYKKNNNYSYLSECPELFEYSEWVYVGDSGSINTGHKYSNYERIKTLKQPIDVVLLRKLDLFSNANTKSSEKFKLKSVLLKEKRQDRLTHTERELENISQFNYISRCNARD